jgi:hypothetical protein
MKNLLSIVKSPIFLFVFFGVLLYAGYSTITGIVEKNNKTITVNAMQYQVQKELFTKTWNRTPSDEELQGQIDNLVMDEIFYREAVALGLDKSDPAVKRRLRQMMELMLEDYTTVTPNENQLRNYLSENPEKFITDYKLSFEHLYFEQDEKEEAEQFLQNLKTDNTLASSYTNKISMIPARFTNETASDISRYLGEEFTELIIETDSKDWFGPVASPYGYHLVRIGEKTPGEVPELNDIWMEVEREWSAQRKIELKKEHYRTLMNQYVIVYEKDENI